VRSWRINTFLVFVFILAAIIIGRLFYLQIISHTFYQSQALGQQAGFKEVKGNRGEIFFSNSKNSDGKVSSGEIKSMAINKQTYTLYAVPEKIKDKDVFSETLKKAFDDARVQGMTAKFIRSKLDESSTYAIIKKDVPKDAVDAIKKLHLEGLYSDTVQQRYYPQDQLASNVVGFLGGNDHGQYGVEGYYDDVLKGKDGIVEEGAGLNANYNGDPSYLNGSDLYLTIDYNIQFQAEALLKQAKHDIDIDSGQIIVLKPDSGRVLALANFPSFDPNKYYQEKNFEVFQNSTVQKIFEPGSVFKPFTMAMALEEHKITPQTIFTDTGSVVIGSHTIYNFDRKSYGQQDMSGILEKSINTGAVFVSKLISPNTFLDYIDKFGFNNKTGIDAQGEVSSRNENLKKGHDFEFATASFGQGIEMTSLQLASAFSVFANGGKPVKPYLVEKIIHGQEEQSIQQVSLLPAISETTASEVAKMMINVVDRGFGKSAKVDGYYLAGKTGTAEVPLKDGKGYYADKTIQSFIGFGPALKPQFLILIKLDNPKVPKSSLSAAPIFQKLAKYIIDYWQIPPDY